MKKSRLKNLFGNMALFTIGNFVSKLLVMLLVPLYTNVLSTEEYGIADGMQTTLLLLVPLFTINIGEAALRYGIERVKERGSILKIMLRYILFADVVIFALCGVGYAICRLAGSVIPVWNGAIMRPEMYFLLFELLFVCNSLYEGMILYCQGCEQVKIMITGSICSTALIIASNIYFLLVARIGLYGYMISQMTAFLGAALLMLALMRKNPFAQKDDAALEGEMVRYGRGMLLYSTSSWANNAIDRYFVIAMCGAAVNGLYAVAYKIPAILTVLQRIFAQAWQISANKTYEDEDASEFFGRMYTGYRAIMTVGCSFLILAVKPVAGFLFAKDFYEAWEMVPPLLISVVFGALTGFLGSICLAYKDGGSMGRATGVGALVNIVLNFVFIKQMGAMGAAMATMISYYVMFAMSYRAAMRHARFDGGRVRDDVTYLLLLVQMLFVSGSLRYGVIVSAACFALIAIIYFRTVFGIVKARFFGNEGK